MTLNVFSEIGQLRRVLIHRPGHEIDWMVPSMMERLLFDDILYGEEARSEHDAFRGVLEAAGAEVLDPEALLAEVLEGNDVVRDDLLARLQRAHALGDDVLRDVEALPADRLATALITGLRAEEPEPDGRLRDFYRLPPVPNYFFQRDPQTVLGDRVLVSSMATEAREREPMLARAIFEHHPALAAAASPIILPGTDDEPSRRAMIEGGDVLVPSASVLLVGLSERTNRRGVEALANALRGAGTSFRQILAVELPAQRSYMHLDTVFTFIDEGLCLAYLPVIAAHGSEVGPVYRIELDAPEISYRLYQDLPHALAEVGIEIELLPCGGSASLIDQQREQWTDGANAFALAPGVIVIYLRNRRTTEVLVERGWRVLSEREVLDGAPVLGQGPTVVTLEGDELSRARGGPRCMTMPLERDAVR